MFNDTYQTVIGTRAALMKEQDEIAQLELICSGLTRKFDPALPSAVLRKLISRIDDALSSVPRSRFTVASTIGAFDNVNTKLLQLKQECFIAVQSTTV